MHQIHYSIGILAKMLSSCCSLVCFQVTKHECLKAGAKEDDLLEILGDITSEEVQNKLINETVKKFKRLDILVTVYSAAYAF